jgi:hypothetical protein
VSRYELTRIFKRLSGWTTGDAAKLATLLLDLSGPVEGERGDFTEAKTVSVCQQLTDMLGDYSVYDAEGEQKVCAKIIQALVHRYA